VTAVIAELENEMLEASAKLEFERAAVLRDQIEALKTGNFRKLGKPSVRYARKPAKRTRR